MREHKPDKQHDGPRPQATGDRQRDAAIARKLADRDPIVKAVRQEMCEQVGRAAQAISVGANLFQTAVRQRDEWGTEKTLHPDRAMQLAHGVVGHIEGKFKAALLSVSGIGSIIGSHASTAFGLVKGVIDKRIAAEGKLTVWKVADAVTAGLLEASVKVDRHLRVAVMQISPERIRSIGKVLDTAEAGAATDEDDSEERGNLGEGLRQWALTDLIGLPAGGLVAAEDLAISAFADFSAQVAAQGTAAEQVDAAQHALKHPGEARERVEGAEAQMGPEFQGELERDRTLKARVAGVRP